MASLDGMWLGRRRILRRIGAGGMGEVYLAEEPYLHRQVAIKVIGGVGAVGESADDIQRRFAQEARAIAALDHPHILPLYDYGEQDGIHYLVTPYVQDGSLTDLLTRDPQRRFTLPLSSTRTIQIITQTAESLQYAHDRGIVHRDVKPQNLLVRLSSSASAPLSAVEGAASPALHILLADFGVARFMEELSSQTGATGTPLYSPPEQFAGRPVYASDQYALACVAYLLLTGQPIFRGTVVELLYQHLHASPLPPSRLNPALPSALDSTLFRALAKQPADRYPRVEQFAQALSAALQSAMAPGRSRLLPADSDGEARITSVVAPSSAHAQAYGADVAQSPLTEIDPDRVMSEPLTVPDTAHEMNSPAPTAPKRGAKPHGRSAGDTRARPASVKPRGGAKRPTQRALLLALALVTLGALVVGATYGGVSVLHRLSNLGMRNMQMATATQTAGSATTVSQYPTAPPGYSFVTGQTFAFAHPSDWVEGADSYAGELDADLTFLASSAESYPGVNFQATQYPFFGPTGTPSAQDLLNTYAGHAGALGPTSSNTIAGVTWLQASEQFSTPTGDVILAHYACVHNNMGYIFTFTSLATNYDSDYARYYHPMLLSFIFTS